MFPSGRGRGHVARLLLAAAALVGLFAMHGLAEHGLQAFVPASSENAPAAMAGMAAALHGGMHGLHGAMSSVPESGASVASTVASSMTGPMGNHEGGGTGGHLMLTGLCLAVLLLAVALFKTLPAVAWPTIAAATGSAAIPAMGRTIRTTPRHALQVMRC